MKNKSEAPKRDSAEKADAGQKPQQKSGRGRTSEFKPFWEAEPAKAAAKEAVKEAGVAETPAKAAGRRDRPVVMDLSHPSSPEKSREARLLTGPEELVAAMRAGTDPARPSAERLTHLRGAMAKGGFRIAEVGFGEGGEAGPARWEAVEKWIAREAVPQPRHQPEPDPGP